MREALSKMIEVTRGLQIEDFSSNWITISAVRDQVMILGEAAKHESPDITEQYPLVPWSQLAKTRDKLIHGYLKLIRVYFITWRQLVQKNCFQ